MREVSRLHYFLLVYHSKVLSGAKKERNQCFFLWCQRYSWTKVLRIGLLARAYALIFRNQNPAYTIKKKDGETLIYWLEFQFEWFIGRAALLHWVQPTWQLAHHRAFDEVAARAPVQSETLRLFTLWSARFDPSTN
jgi:hypothetical protein